MSKKGEKVWYFVRQFLNLRHHSWDASILFRIRKKKNYGGNGFRVSTDFSIRDCSDSVNLDFDSGTKAQRKNSLYKAASLRKAIVGFEAALIEAYADIEEENKREKKSKDKG